MSMKNRLIFSYLFCLLCFSASAQNEKWDSTFRPNNYELKVELFKSFPDAKSDIVFLGNSITAGTDWMELLGRTDVRNRGISGEALHSIRYSGAANPSTAIRKELREIENAHARS